MSSDLIRWLHLSDFHVGKDSGAEGRVFGYILENVREKVDAGFAPHMVFITGDITNEGKEKQYADFSDKFLIELKQILDPVCPGRIFVVPGNHDVQRRECKAANPHNILSEVPEFFDTNSEGQNQRACIFPRFRNFAAFDVGGCCDGSHWIMTQSGALVHIFDFRKLKIGVLLLHTAWLSKNDEDRHKMSPGLNILEQGMKKLKPCDIRFVVGHHPIDWFSDQKKEQCEALLAKNRAIYLYGHTHRNRSKLLSGGGLAFCSIQSGPCFQHRDWRLSPPRFVWAALEVAKGRILIEPIRWSNDYEWKVDVDAFTNVHKIVDCPPWCCFQPVPWLRLQTQVASDTIVSQQTSPQPPHSEFAANSHVAAPKDRPIMSKELREEILRESGYCCAVCGESCQIQIAHIVPWRYAKEYDKEDLICLCENCHRQFDMEGWGANKLKEYKIRPWVFRRYASLELNLVSPIRIRLSESMEDSTSNQEHALKFALTQFLQIPPEEIRIEEVERGNTEIILELPTESGNKLVQAVKQRDKSLVNSITSALGKVTIADAEDCTHSLRRALAFKCFEKLLDSCMAAQCPKLHPDLHYYLIDISAEGYLLERAYHQRINDIGSSDSVHDYCIARARVTRMFTCPVVQPSLDGKIFELDGAGDTWLRESTIRRKAYWRYLSKRDNSETNYFSAERFLKYMQDYEALRFGGDIRSLIDILDHNLDMASALDLYHFCYIRQRTNQILPTQVDF